MALLAIAVPAGADSGRGRASTVVALTPAGNSWSVLREALLSRDYGTRLFATQTLGEVRNVDVTGWLQHMLGDPEHDVRVAAVDALKRIGSPQAIALLKKVRDDASEALDVRALAAAALITHNAD